jgi:hypothetical protein
VPHVANTANHAAMQAVKEDAVSDLNFGTTRPIRRFVVAHVVFGAARH